ncbi:MAG: restriction endonuclease, partial [Chthoniobacteraceae bacterium]
KRRIEATVSFREAKPEELAAKRSPDTLKIEIADLNQERADYLAKHPHKLHELSPRKFEELMTDLLKNRGCEVEIQKQTRDGGRDILAAFPSPFGRLLTIVECKKYRADRPVGIAIAERFLYVLNDKKDKASCGLIATTSYFSPEVQALAAEIPYRLKLRDFEGIRDWIANYGKWVHEEESSFWIPNA